MAELERKNLTWNEAKVTAKSPKKKTIVTMFVELARCVLIAYVNMFKWFKPSARKEIMHSEFS